MASRKKNYTPEEIAIIMEEGNKSYDLLKKFGPNKTKFLKDFKEKRWSEIVDQNMA